jgi:hypothetical protein
MEVSWRMEAIMSLVSFLLYAFPLLVEHFERDGQYLLSGVMNDDIYDRLKCGMDICIVVVYSSNKTEGSSETLKP